MCKCNKEEISKFRKKNKVQESVDVKPIQVCRNKKKIQITG